MSVSQSVYRVAAISLNVFHCLSILVSLSLVVSLSVSVSGYLCFTVTVSLCVFHNLCHCKSMRVSQSGYCVSV